MNFSQSCFLCCSFFGKSQPGISKKGSFFIFLRFPKKRVLYRAIFFAGCAKEELIPSPP